MRALQHPTGAHAKLYARNNGSRRNASAAHRAEIGGRAWAHRVLDRAKAGQPVPSNLIEQALLATGDA